MTPKQADVENRTIAQILDEVGDLLAQQDASVFRVRAVCTAFANHSILHVERSNWGLTALFSNTPNAQR